MSPARGQPTEGDDAELFYRRFWRSPGWGGRRPNEDERSRLDAITGLLSRCGLAERAQILDLGCGRGWLTDALAAWGEVLGTDVLAASVERARELFPHRTFEQIDLQQLIVERGAGSFDLVVSSEVIEHVPAAEKRTFVGGIHRLLKPGGWAILTTPRAELQGSWQAGGDPRQPVEEWISEAELDQIVSESGFTVERRTRAHVCGITPLSRLHASRAFRALTRWAPFLARLTYGSRIYQVVLLRRAE